MKGGFRKAVDTALWFLGARRRPSPDRPQRKPVPASSSSGAAAPVLSDSGIWHASDLRRASEIDRYEQVAESLATRVHADRGWLQCLSGIDTWQSAPKLEYGDLKTAERLGLELSARLFDLVSHFSSEYNELTHQVISMTPLSDISEKRKVSKAMGSVETTESVTYNRWRASTNAWAISCRVRSGIIEIFLLPASDLMALSQAEAPLRLKIRLELLMLKVSGRFVWTCDDGLPVSAEDLRVFMRMVFKDLVSATVGEEQTLQSTSTLSNLDAPRLARSIEHLLIERQSLAQKVVIQQEEIQKRIARDLHDAVISDVMALKRNIASLNSLPTEETLAALEVIVRKLREICYDLSPRDLSDWGLSTVVEDMLDQIAQRTGIDCVLNCDIEIPVVPAPVLLHIYRIIQESLNNAEKYAEPSRVVVSLEMEGSLFIIKVADDGKGFELDSSSEISGRTGGYGMGSLKERADLIRCFYPTKFVLNSTPGKGTLVRLEIDLSHFL